MFKPSDLLSPKDVAEFVGDRVSVKTLANWRSRRETRGPKARKLFGKVVYRREDVEAWVANALEDKPDGAEAELLKQQAAERARERLELERQRAELRRQLALLNEQIGDGGQLGDAPNPPKRPRGRPRKIRPEVLGAA